MPEDLVVQSDPNHLGDMISPEWQALPPRADSPESMLSRGLAAEMYGKIEEAEELLQPAITGLYEAPLVLTSKDSLGYTLTDAFHIQNSAAGVNELVNTRTFSNGMTQTSRVQRLDNKGSFQIHMSVMTSPAATVPKVRSLTYHAPHEEYGIPEQVTLADSEMIEQLPPGDPRRVHTLDILKGGLNVVHAAAERIATDHAKAEALKSHERVPLDFAQLVAGDEDIVMFGENHYHTAVMDTIAQNAAVLREGGIRALLLEADGSQDFSAINQGDFSSLDAESVNIGPDLRFMGRMEYERLGIDYMAVARQNMIKALVGNGIAVIPVDSQRYHAYMRAIVKQRDEGVSYPESMKVSQAEREQDMAKNIDVAVDQYGRVACLMGRAHARKGELTNGSRRYRETAQYALDHGHSVRTVHFHGGERYGRSKTAAQPSLYLTENGWGDRSYMYRPAVDDPLAIAEKGRPDWIAYIPPNQFEAEFGPVLLTELPGIPSS